MVVAIVILLLSLVATIDRRPNPEKNLQELPSVATDAIFVAIIAMPGDEAECARCLRTLFTNAWAPERVQVVVLHYFDPDARRPGGVGIDSYYSSVRAQYDRVCLQTPGSRNCGDCIRVIERPVQKAAGIAPAHAELLKLAYTGEPFWCEAFPKLRFTRQWDQKAVNELRKCFRLYGPKSLLTVAPADRFTGNRPPFPVVDPKLGQHGFPRVVPRLFQTAQPGRPFAAPLLSPRFIFAPAAAITRDVPPDSKFQFCEDAEPLLRSARLYTYGWGFYSPSCTLVHRHRINPVDADEDCEVIPFSKTVTANARQRRELSYIAALSVLGEDLCAVCDRARSEHTAK